MSGKVIIKTGKEIYKAIKSYELPNPNTLGWFLTEKGSEELEYLEKQKWKLVK